jgi:hypothetical protein
LFLGSSAALAGVPIDRHALVSRHDLRFTAPDPHAPVMLGNGSLGFTADLTGLQTFPELYAPTSPLLTMAQGAWHRFPNPYRYRARDGEVSIEVPGRGAQPFGYVRDMAHPSPAVAWLRENPHRYSLARVSLVLRHADGREVHFAELKDTVQRLDLWTGTLTSRFRLDGQPVTVVTRVAAPRDLLLVEVRSPLIAAGRVGLVVRYPGVARTLNPDPSDWTHPDRYRTTVLGRGAGRVTLLNRVDGSRIWSSIAAPGAEVGPAGAHAVTICAPGRDRIAAVIGLERFRIPGPLPAFRTAVAGAEGHWRRYWRQGGVVDLSGTADPRAAELERRIVLSQYLAAINEAGTVPPQEEGLFSNSWNGKFHLEMLPWHAGHFAAWGRPRLLERALGWYIAHLPQALAEGRRHGLDAAWWPKMAGPEGRNSPSAINPLIFWQQPHAIYLAELLWHAHPNRATLRRYDPVVEATARLLAGWPRRDPATGLFHLGPPIIPVQENHDPFATHDPAFELEQFRWGLQTAQAWRVRLGRPRVAAWDQVIAHMAPMPMRDGRYLPTADQPGFWMHTASAACRADGHASGCTNTDHPSFLMAYGLIGSDRVDRAAMARTLAATDANWDWARTWGWDPPMVAMTAARLGDREAAVGWLLRDLPNYRWGATGMTQRFDIFGAPGPDGRPPRLADSYFPSNGALLLAVGMMAAGWTGSTGPTPGFPVNWHVRAEGLNPLP